MLHKSSAAASACSLPSPPAGATPLWQIPFPASVLSPAQSQPVPISNPLPLLAFFISFALFCHFSPRSPLSCLLPFLTRGRQKVLDSIYKICLLPLLFLFLFTLLSFSFSFSSPTFYDYFCIICQSKIINF